tara:strand:- start:690 stop:1634 length:945 start_codon:yes stop_codon:yes gene_type:complete
MKKKIRVSFIGAGEMTREHLKVFSNNKNYEIAGIYSKSKKKVNDLKKKYKLLESFNCIKDLNNETNSDLVVISIYETEVIKMYKKILQYKWICLFEKPLGINLRETLKILKYIKSNKKKVFISLNRRFYQSTILAKKLIFSNHSKRKLFINDSQSKKIFYKKRKNIKATKYLMYCNSIHLIDYISIFCRGKILKIKKYLKWNSKKNEDVFVKILFSSGDQAIYYSFWKTYEKWFINLSNDKAEISFKPLEKINIINPPNKNKKNFYYKVDNLYKPGLWNQSNEIVNFFKKKKYNLISEIEYLKTAKLINLIYKM